MSTRTDEAKFVTELRTALLSTDDLLVWRNASSELVRDPDKFRGAEQRKVRLAILATHTSGLLAPFLPVAAWCVGIDLDVYQAPFGQLEQEVFKPSRNLISYAPDYVMLSGTVEDLSFDTEIAGEGILAEVRRWTQLWHLVEERIGARAIQDLFAPPVADPYANFSMSCVTSKTSLVRRLNAELRTRGHERVITVDSEYLANQVGGRIWRNSRHWHAYRQAVSLDLLPALAKLIAGELAADLGLTRRCLVVDLDNTLWDGVVGDDGTHAVGLRDGPRGEAFQEFQEYLLALRRRGIALAVASKNDISVVRLAFAEVPGMRISLDDFAAVVADWRPKSRQLMDISSRLGISTRSLAFIDDNPAECSQVMLDLPEVDVIQLPAEPAEYIGVLNGRPTLATSRVTSEDLSRGESYRALDRAHRLKEEATTLDEFLRGLRMVSRIRYIGRDCIDRVAQLVQKTNQFNLTTRRRNRNELHSLSADPSWRCLTMDLRDKFADHGLVGVALVRIEGDIAEVDTLLLSCRVIGRTAEDRLLAAAARSARDAGCGRLRGRYIPTARNDVVRTLYPDLGFRRVSREEHLYEICLESTPEFDSSFIEVEVDEQGPSGNRIRNVSRGIGRGAATRR